MTEYKGRWEAIRGPLIMLSILIALAAIIYFFIPHGFWAYFFIVLFLIFVPFAYNGIILKITIDEKKLVVVRPLARIPVKFEDVALCAVHCIEEGKHIIYAFVKQTYRGGYTVKGIRPKLPFDEVVKMASEDENIDLNINFNMAKKIPVSFVHGGVELKDRFIMEVDKYHVKVREDKA